MIPTVLSINSKGIGTPQITNLDVKCGRTEMTVIIEFDQKFHGVIYSKGHFHESSCNYVTPTNTGKSKYM